jgi:site-specific DNA-methyltransferase (cytosine-N4-specific)
MYLLLLEIKMIENNMIYLEDCQETIAKMPDDFLDLVVTSPPYFGCRSYGNETLGREENPLEYINNIAFIAKKLKRVLKPTGTFYLNIGDVYFGTKGFSRNKGKYARKTDVHYKEHKIVQPDGKYLQYKQLLLLPTRIASAMQDDGWILRNNIIWEKTNPIPSHCPDRRMPCYEYIFHFVKNKKYYFNWEMAKELNSHRDFFRTNVKPFRGHPAAFNEDVIGPLIKTSTQEGDLIYDPFMGSGTTAVVAKKYNRNYIGSEINPEYLLLSLKNLNQL